MEAAWTDGAGVWRIAKERDATPTRTTVLPAARCHPDGEAHHFPRRHDRKPEG